jgi:HPt (histidine-containing phosphotransfer) domain-containing protein
MTVKECYEAMGADYAGVAGRLRTDERIRKFLLMFLEDTTYELLCTSMENKNIEEAFRAAHTMKGMCQNLSLDPLYRSSSQLTEALRGATAFSDESEALLSAVKADYEKTVECISALQKI